MKHLVSFSVYEDTDVLSPDLDLKFNEIGCDGLELLTGYDKVPSAHRRHAVAVHLPYAADWYRAWNENDVPACDPDTAKFTMYGTCKDEVSNNLATAITIASEINPPYGVLHAGNVSLDDVLKHQSGISDRNILSSFCEMINSAVSLLPKGRPPFKLALENLWWPGLRMMDGWEVKFFEQKLEFEEWGICLDTGHLLNCLPCIRNEEEALCALEKIFYNYSSSVKDKIDTVHLHFSASSDYRNRFIDCDKGDDTMDVFMEKANSHISKIDQHRPFSSPRCAEIVKIIEPSYVTHEMNGAVSGDLLGDFRLQRSHFFKK
ncbi:MAG TPA: hypothetical protein VJY42_04320 [Candidatus Methanomethylophilaceae archaeon]|nr:hypothetical protein [Candidatus Methanomethylophilaceae archaeon]